MSDAPNSLSTGSAEAQARLLAALCASGEPIICYQAAAEIRRLQQLLDIGAHAQRPVDSGEAAQRLQARKNVSFDIAADINGLLDDYVSIPSAEALRRSDAEAAVRGALWDNKAGIVSLLMAFAKEPTQGGDKGEAVAYVPLSEDGRPQWAETFGADDGCYVDYPEKWKPLYAAPQPVSNIIAEILKHVRAPNRPISDRLDRIEEICTSAYASRASVIEECAALMRRWADEASEFKDDRACVIQANICRNAAVAIGNLAKVASALPSTQEKSHD